jgi:hypothetical protein
MFQQGGNNGQAYQQVQDQGHYGQAPEQKQYGQYDPEMGYGKPVEEGGSYAAFMEKEVRRGFIRKVFCILAVQLFVTFGAAIMMSTNSHVKAYCTGNMWPFYLSIPMVIASLIGLSCCGDLHRKFPHNYGLLAVFTIGESYMVGMATLSYETTTVLQAILITGVLTTALVLYAFQTKYDFSTMGGVLLCSLVGLIMFSFMAMFIQQPIVHLIFSCMGALLFSFYIIYDVQILMEGKRVQLSPDDYVLAAINLYLDIINLFIYILQILDNK